MPVPIGRLIATLAAEAPDAPSITCDATTITRRQLDQRSNQLARDYESQGVGPGDLVTLALGNEIEFFEAAAAIWKLGAVVTPVSPRLPERELASIVELADPALIVGIAPDTFPARRTLPAGYRPSADVDDGPMTPDRVPPRWKAMTSGGSTGTPKLIVSGAPGVVEPTDAAAAGLRKDGVALIPGPMYHNMPFSAAFGSLFYGNRVVTQSKFNARAALQAIDAFGVEVVNLVPTMMLRMWRILENDPSAFNLGSLRRLWHMGSPCPEWLKQAWIDRLGADRVFELYGGTESQAMTMISGTEWLEHRGSVGRPVLGEMTILAPDGRALPPGEVGEIYMRRPEGTPPTYRYIGATARELDGWESLGDMGSLDEDGYLYISDRRVDMILAGGANIYPAEVESALLAHPLVESAIVVGLPDADLGQRVHAIVHAAGELTAEELAAFVGDRLVRYKVPRSFRFVDYPLRDDAGKARRTAIRDAETALLS